MNPLERFRGCLLGLAAGDAVGTTVEFQPPGSFTTAAICGQVAGAYYGESGIPSHWLKQLTMGSEIGELAEQLYATAA